MWKAVILTPPACQGASYVIQRSEPACVEALVAQPSVEALDMPVLHRLARLDVQQPDVPVLRPANLGREVNSGPLSQRRFSGLPRSPISRSCTRVTRGSSRSGKASSLLVVSASRSPYTVTSAEASFRFLPDCAHGAPVHGLQ